MKIAQLTPGYPPMLGGVENSVFEVVKQLKLRKHEVTVLTSSYGYLSSKDVIRLPSLLNLKRDWGDMLFCPSILKVLKNHSFDVIHAHTPIKFFAESAAVSNILGINRAPYLVSIRLINASLPPLLGATSDVYRKTIESLIFKRAKKVIVQTKANKVFLNREAKVSLNKLEVLPNGVDTDFFNPIISKDDSRAMYNLSNENVIVFAGRLTSQKGCHHLVQAVSQIAKDVTDLKVLMGGDGPQRQYLENLTRKYGVNNLFKFVGKIPHSKMPQFLATGDVMAMPSLSESFPNIMLEALAMELATIATEVGVVPEILVDDHTAKLIAPGDVKGLADSLLMLFSDKKLRYRLGMNARLLVKEKFSWNSVAERSLEIYEQVLYT